MKECKITGIRLRGNCIDESFEVLVDINGKEQSFIKANGENICHWKSTKELSKLSQPEAVKVEDVNIKIEVLKELYINLTEGKVIHAQAIKECYEFFEQFSHLTPEPTEQGGDALEFFRKEYGHAYNTPLDTLEAVKFATRFAASLQPSQSSEGENKCLTCIFTDGWKCMCTIQCDEFSQYKPNKQEEQK